jgi:hypothetical protein
MSVTLFIVIVGCAAQYLIEVMNLHFGNYFVSVTNALVAASYTKEHTLVVISGAPSVFNALPRQVVFHQGKLLLDHIFNGNRTQLKKLVASYFYASMSHHIASPDPTYDKRIEAFEPFVARVLGQIPAPAPEMQPFLGADGIVLHIRSGDIFGSNKQSDYWQPPLGYYQLASLDYPYILVISENSLNPVVRSFYSRCASDASKVCEQSVNRSLMTDVSLLTNAQNVVIGYGSFMVAIAALSRKMSSLVYPYTMLTFFPKNFNIVEQCARYKRISTVRIDYDRRMSRKGQEWKGSPEHIQLLLTDADQLTNVSYTIVKQKKVHL